MTKKIQLLRGTTAENDIYVGSEGEITVDTTTHELRVHDGVTCGGYIIPTKSAAITITLAVNDWSSNTQTVSATGVTASNNVIVAAAPNSQSDYTSAGILCTAQGAGTLTFTCTTTPTTAISVNVLIFE